LTQQLLAFSRKQVVRTGPLDLNGLIRESQGVLNSVLGDDILISTRLADDLSAIQADRGQMHQVLMNLAVNAREAMPGGGALTIETRNVGAPAEVLLEIRDSGQGMDEKTRRHLFEPFFTTKKGSKNSGLGLAIVFAIVNRGGGRIDVESRPGAGSAFRIFLPPVAAAAVEQPQSRPAQGSPRGAGVVLLVDDREDVRTLVRRMLQDLGYQTLEAASGEQALAVARDHGGALPLLLTDVVMPGMNGRELAEQLKAISPNLKTVFMSGYTDHILTKPGTLASEIHYLQKPFTLPQLAEILRTAEQS
jgi:CheY-like chemotaxis protein